jgi:hypothetical protein
MPLHGRNIDESGINLSAPDSFYYVYYDGEGRDSSAGIATRCEVDGPWIESRRGAWVFEFVCCK